MLALSALKERPPLVLRHRKVVELLHCKTERKWKQRHTQSTLQQNCVTICQSVQRTLDAQSWSLAITLPASPPQLFVVWKATYPSQFPEGQMGTHSCLVCRNSGLQASNCKPGAGSQASCVPRRKEGRKSKWVGDGAPPGRHMVSTGTGVAVGRARASLTRSSSPSFINQWVCAALSQGALELYPAILIWSSKNS